MSEPKKKRRSGAPKEATKRQTDYVTGVLAGKTKKQAALDAGFAPSTADRTQCINDSLAVRRLFAAALAERKDKVIARIDEGLDATTKDGDTDFEQRGKYCDRVVKYGQLYTEKLELDVSDKRNDGERLGELLARAAERARTVSGAGGAGGSTPDPRSR